MAQGGLTKKPMPRVPTIRFYFYLFHFFIDTSITKGISFQGILFSKNKFDSVSPLEEKLLVSLSLEYTQIHPQTHTHHKMTSVVLAADRVISLSAYWLSVTPIHSSSFTVGQLMRFFFLPFSFGVYIT